MARANGASSAGGQQAVNRWTALREATLLEEQGLVANASASNESSRRLIGVTGDQGLPSLVVLALRVLAPKGFPSDEGT